MSYVPNTFPCLAGEDEHHSLIVVGSTSMSRGDAAYSACLSRSWVEKTEHKTWECAGQEDPPKDVYSPG